jgi:hypothetical protein
MFDVPSEDDIARVVVTREVVLDNVLPTVVRATYRFGRSVSSARRAPDPRRPAASQARAGVCVGPSRSKAACVAANRS